MDQDHKGHLRHISDAIQQIDEYLKDASLDQFLRDRLLQDGVVRQLEIMDEASRKLPDDFRNHHSEVSWSLIIGVKDRIVHEYFDLNLRVVWEFVQNHLPSLKQNVARISESS